MTSLVEYFTHGIRSRTLGAIGSEIETQFVDQMGVPITIECSQNILKALSDNGWKIETTKGSLITTLVDQEGNKVFYELGRHNLELATVASTTEAVLPLLTDRMGHLYETAARFGALPFFGPIIETEEDLLVIPDERDAVWLERDGRAPLTLLARTSSVQFTFTVTPDDAITILNKLGQHIDHFLLDFPQDAIWKRYIAESKAGYAAHRYGGPLVFESIEDYCRRLASYDVVRGKGMIPFDEVHDLDLSLHIRSVWWHFRLKRYGNDLCIEIRPMARRADGEFPRQLRQVLDIVC